MSISYALIKLIFGVSSRLWSSVSISIQVEFVDHISEIKMNLRKLFIFFLVFV